MTQPAGHADLAARRSVWAQRLAQPEHARRRRDAPDAPARIVRRARQPEQLRVRQHAARRADAPGHLRVGAPVAVQVDRLAVDRDVDVAIPRDARQRRPVARVRVDQRRRRIARRWRVRRARYPLLRVRDRSRPPRAATSTDRRRRPAPCRPRLGRGRRAAGDFLQPAPIWQQQDRGQRVTLLSPCASRTSSLPPAPCWRRWRR